ncbi:MAG: MerR family transcriptional regulator [Comamonadaceae bacterium]|nr:MAG: MerR family transcriptional regulator [Comamonadaceae bacterium]
MPRKQPLKIRIGELARRTGRTVHTIRWYEQQGLLPPVPRLGAHRIYSNRHVEWLELMERLRSSGMSVAELRRYTVLAQRGAVHLHELREMLEAHRQQLQDRMAELRRAERLVDEKIAFYAQWIAEGERPPGHGGRQEVPAPCGP